MLPHVLPSVHGCPDALAIDHLVKAARVFCARTLVWNYSCRPILSAQDVADYTLQIADDEEVVRVLLCTVDGREYAIPTGVRGRQDSRLGNMAINGEQCVLRGTQDFTLIPTPTTDDLPIVLDVAVKPKLTSTRWPEDMDDHVSDIVHGALWTLCSLPNATWANQPYATAQREQFERRVAVVAAKVQRGFGRSSQPSRVTFF